MRTVRAVGIDVGTTALHAVALTGADPRDVHGSEAERRAGALVPAVTAVHLALAHRPSSLHTLHDMCVCADGVGIDAPDRRTGGCRLEGSPMARCAEVALAARGHGLAERLAGGPVSMLTPPLGADFPARLKWMEAGFELWSALTERCTTTAVTETYPSGSFRRLAARAVPPVKLVARRTPAGASQRLELLDGLVETPLHGAMWGLDGVDALAAALAAYALVVGRGAILAEHTHPGHDGSRIALLT